jgi:hypothetical protein
VERIPKEREVTRRSRYNQHYALNCTTPVFNILAPTCFGSSLPSSGSFLDPSELLDFRSNRWYIIQFMFMWPVCRNFVVGTTTLRHTDHINIHYMIYHLFDLKSGNSDGSKKLPDDGRLLPKHVGASILNTGVVQFSA